MVGSRDMSKPIRESNPAYHRVDGAGLHQWGTGFSNFWHAKIRGHPGGPFAVALLHGDN